MSPLKKKVKWHNKREEQEFTEFKDRKDPLGRFLHPSCQCWITAYSVISSVLPSPILIRASNAPLGRLFHSFTDLRVRIFFPDVHPRRGRGSASPKSHTKPELHSQELISVEYLGHFKVSECSQLAFTASKH